MSDKMYEQDVRFIWRCSLCDHQKHIHYRIARRAGVPEQPSIPSGWVAVSKVGDCMPSLVCDRHSRVLMIDGAVSDMVSQVPRDNSNDPVVGTVEWLRRKLLDLPDNATFQGDIADGMPLEEVEFNHDQYENGHQSVVLKG